MVGYQADASDAEDSGGKISFYTENETEYVKISFSEKFNSLDELNTYLNSLGSDTSETDISGTFFENIKVEFNKDENSLSISGKILKQSNISSYASCDIIFSFPGKIISTDIGEKVDDNTIKINMLEIWEASSTPTFAIKANASSLAFIFIIIAVAFVALIVTSCIIIRKKSLSKKSMKTETANDENVLEDMNENTENVLDESNELN